MNNDRELLELAARAAGMWHDPANKSEIGLYAIIENGFFDLWNPLKSDGAALRLAITLKMSVTVFDDAIGIGITNHGYLEYSINGCVFESTRRAITRAAAEIGKAMG